MTWFTLTLFLGLAIFTHCFIQTRSRDFEQFIGILVAAIFLTVSLTNAPILFKGLVLLWLVVEPKLRHQRSTS